MIQKHAIPILEFDDNPRAVIMPNHEGLDLHFTKEVCLCFLEEEIDRYAREVGRTVSAEFFSATKTYPVYVMSYKGKEVCLAQAPCWFSSSSPVYGLVGLAMVWSRLFPLEPCGVLADIEENAFLVPVRALRDEGASYHYVAPSRYMEIQPEATAAIERVLEAKGIPYEEVMTWTTDGFTEKRLKRWLIERKKAVLLWRWSVLRLQQ